MTKRTASPARVATRIVSLWSIAVDRNPGGDYGKVHRADATHTLCGIAIPPEGPRKEWANQRGTCTRCEAINARNNAQEG